MKKPTTPQYLRARTIMEMIRRGAKQVRYPNSTDFMRELEVSWITTMRDLDYLRDELRAPIEYDASRKGFYLSDETWRLPAVELSRAEVFAFSIANKLVRTYRGTPLEMDLVSTFEKIAESLEGNLTLDLEGLTDRITVLGEDYAIVDQNIWTRVASAIDRGETLKMRYQRFDGAVKSYTIAPYHMIAYHGDWYLLARPSHRDHTATFAVSRVQSVEPTGVSFERPADFDVEAHIADAFGIVRGDERFKVRLLFSPKVATYIRNRVWHEGQLLKARKNGSVELQFETAGWKELVRWVLSWQPDVKVLAPKRLRIRIEEKMRVALGA